MSFLEGLIQAKPPLKPFVDAETNLSVFISLLLPKVHFLKVGSKGHKSAHEVPIATSEARV